MEPDKLVKTANKLTVASVKAEPEPMEKVVEEANIVGPVRKQLLQVITYDQYHEVFESSVQKFQWIALYARAVFYAILLMQSCATALGTFTTVEIGSTIQFAAGLLSIVFTAILAVVPLQRVNIQCTDSAAIIMRCLLSKEPLSLQEFSKIAKTETFCCINPLRLGDNGGPCTTCCCC